MTAAGAPKRFTSPRCGQKQMLKGRPAAGVEWQYQTAYFLSDTNLESSSPLNGHKNPSYTIMSVKGGSTTMLRKHRGIEAFARHENIFDENYAFAALHPANAPAFGPFIGRNVFDELSVRYVFD